MIALIDMDLVLFRSAISAEDDGFGIAKHRAENLLEGLMKKTDAIDFRGFISSKTNFRKTVMPSYKANRTKIYFKSLVSTLVGKSLVRTGRDLTNGLVRQS